MRFQCKCSSSANKLAPERHLPISLHLVGSWDRLVSEIYIQQSESQRLQDRKNGNQVRPIRFRKDKVSPKLNWKKSQTRNLGITIRILRTQAISFSWLCEEYKGSHFFSSSSALYLLRISHRVCVIQFNFWFLRSLIKIYLFLVETPPQYAQKIESIFCIWMSKKSQRKYSFYHLTIGFVTLCWAIISTRSFSIQIRNSSLGQFLFSIFSDGSRISC